MHCSRPLKRVKRASSSLEEAVGGRGNTAVFESGGKKECHSLVVAGGQHDRPGKGKKKKQKCSGQVAGVKKKKKQAKRKKTGSGGGEVGPSWGSEGNGVKGNRCSRDATFGASGASRYINSSGKRADITKQAEKES